MTRIDLFTRDKILQSLHLSDDKIAKMTGVKASTVRRIRISNPPPIERMPMPSNEPYTPDMSAEHIIEASGKLRDAVRAMLNMRARRLGLPAPDWGSLDARGAVE